MAKRKPREAGAPEITAEMLLAGENAFEALFDSYATRDLVRAVYNAMRRLECAPQPFREVRDLRRLKAKEDVG